MSSAAVSEEPRSEAVLSGCVWRVETDPPTQELGWAFLAPSLPAAAQHLFYRLPLTGQKSAKRLFSYLLRAGTFGEKGSTRTLFILNMRRRRPPTTPLRPPPLSIFHGKQSGRPFGPLTSLTARWKITLLAASSQTPGPHLSLGIRVDPLDESDNHGLATNRRAVCSSIHRSLKIQ